MRVVMVYGGFPDIVIAGGYHDKSSLTTVKSINFVNGKKRDKLIDFTPSVLIGNPS